MASLAHMLLVGACVTFFNPVQVVVAALDDIGTFAEGFEVPVVVVEGVVDGFGVGPV